MIIVNPKAVYPGEIPQYESNAQALAAGLKEVLYIITPLVKYLLLWRLTNESNHSSFR